MSEEVVFVNGRYQVKPKSGPPPLPQQMPTPRSNRGSLTLQGPPVGIGLGNNNNNSSSSSSSSANNNNNHHSGGSSSSLKDLFKATATSISLSTPRNHSDNHNNQPQQLEQAFQSLQSSSSLRARDTRRMALGQADLDWRGSDNNSNTNNNNNTTKVPSSTSSLRLRSSGTILLNDLSSLTGSAEPEPEAGAVTDRTQRQRNSWVRGSVEGPITPRSAGDRSTAENQPPSTPRTESNQKSSHHHRKSNSSHPTSPTGKEESSKPVKSPESNKRSEQEREYTSYLEKAEKENFQALEALKMVYHSGYDNNLRPIIVIVASLIPAKTVDLEKLLLFFIKILDPVVNQEYALIYVHTNSGSENIPKFAFLRKCYGIFSRKYKKNLKALYIVQPTSLIKGIAKLFKPFLSNKFWKKLHYINEIKELYQYMNPQQVQFPIELLPSNNASDPEIFGVSLENVMKHPMNMYSPVPLIVLNCMKYLLKNGTHVEGIFRLSGRQQRIEELKDAYDRGEVVDFSSEPDIHVIAGLLKLYFRKLPDPLCCHSLYREWILSFDSTNTEITTTKIKAILKKLPRTNFLTLNSLMGLLSLLKDASEVTKMTANNLAICWAPNILRPQEESLSTALVESNIVNNIISLLITEFNLFFPVSGPEDLYSQPPQSPQSPQSPTSPTTKGKDENLTLSAGKRSSAYNDYPDSSTSSPPVSHKF